MCHWHIITPEYPPQSGGVADYTKQVAEGLRNSGDSVDVWCRGQVAPSGAEPPWVHRELGDVNFRDLLRMDRNIRRQEEPRRLLVQWVPHGFGWRSMNLLFCFWLLKRSWAGDEVDLMVHEPFLSFGEGSLKQDFAALVHRIMTIVLLQSARRVWLSTLSWEKLLRPFALGRKLRFRWLPVPSNIPVHRNQGGAGQSPEDIRSRETTILGHFSSYSLDIAALLRSILPPLLVRCETCVIQLLGRGSEQFREEMIQAYPRLRGQIIASGQVSSERLSARLAACDIVLQPYPDGATTRRTTLMATLEHGLPVVTTVGRLSETFWTDCDAVVMVPAEDPRRFIEVVEGLVRNEAELTRLGKAAATFYATNFGLGRTIQDLRSSTEIAKC